MLHPFMPFITEELVHMVEHGVKRDDLLCLSQWPSLDGLVDHEAAEEVNWVVELISESSCADGINVPARKFHL